MELRSYPGAAAETTLASDITSGSGSFTVQGSTGGGYPDGSGGPFFVIIDWDNSRAEKVRCSSRSGDTFTVAVSGGGRGVDGTTPTSHTALAKVRAVWTATDAAESNKAAWYTIGQVTTKGDLLVSPSVGTLSRLPVGADGNQLFADSSQTTGVRWGVPGAAVDANAVHVQLVDAKGDLIAATANDTVARLPVGANGQVLVADSTQTAGLRWGNAGSVGQVWTGSVRPVDANGVAVGMGTNGAVYFKFRCQETVTVAGLRLAVANSIGNVDVGVYADSSGAPGSRLASAGSTACPAVGLATVAFTASVTLVAGTDYWLALAASSSSATFNGATCNSALVADVARQQTSAFPLPATATPVAYTNSIVHLIGYLT